MLCASCPVLTVPRLSESSSSCSSSLSASPVSLSSLAQSAFDVTESCSEEEHCLISSDVLQEIVKCAFGLSDEAMLRYSQQIRLQYRKKKEAKILAEDLLYQLALLELQKHPYYAPQKFLVLLH